MRTLTPLIPHHSETKQLLWPSILDRLPEQEISPRTNASYCQVRRSCTSLLSCQYREGQAILDTYVQVARPFLLHEKSDDCSSFLAATVLVYKLHRGAGRGGAPERGVRCGTVFKHVH